MKYKLKDVKLETLEGVTEGTCELCMTAPFDYDIVVYVFQDENGKIYEVEDYYQDWGAIIENGLGKFNIAEFALWLKDVDIKYSPYSSKVGNSFHWLAELVQRFQKTYETVDEVEEWPEETEGIIELALEEADNFGYMKDATLDDAKEGFVEGSFDKLTGTQTIKEFEERKQRWKNLYGLVDKYRGIDAGQ